MALLVLRTEREIQDDETRLSRGVFCNHDAYGAGVTGKQATVIKVATEQCAALHRITPGQILEMGIYIVPRRKLDHHNSKRKARAKRQSDDDAVELGPYCQTRRSVILLDRKYNHWPHPLQSFNSTILFVLATCLKQHLQFTLRSTPYNSTTYPRSLIFDRCHHQGTDQLAYHHGNSIIISKTSLPSPMITLYQPSTRQGSSSSSPSYTYIHTYSKSSTQAYRKPSLLLLDASQGQPSRRQNQSINSTHPLYTLTERKQKAKRENILIGQHGIYTQTSSLAPSVSNLVPTCQPEYFSSSRTAAQTRI